MKIDLQGPLIEPPDAFRVGDLFASGSTNDVTAYWLVVALKAGGGAHLLGIGPTGAIVSTATYPAHAIRSRRYVGHCGAIASLTIPLDPEAA